MTTYPFSWAEFEAEAADPANHIAFTPVPRQRARKRGWSPERQELFRAGCYRRRLLVLMNEPGRYVTKERHDQIMRGEW